MPEVVEADGHTGLLACLHPYLREFPSPGASLTRKGTDAVVAIGVRLGPRGREQRQSVPPQAAATNISETLPEGSRRVRMVRPLCLRTVVPSRRVPEEVAHRLQALLPEDVHEAGMHSSSVLSRALMCE